MPCREQAVELLRRGWQPGDEPRYNPDAVLVLCRTHAFRAGLIFLYEKLRLFQEVLRVSCSSPLARGLQLDCMEERGSEDDRGEQLGECCPVASESSAMLAPRLCDAKR